MPSVLSDCEGVAALLRMPGGGGNGSDSGDGDGATLDCAEEEDGMEGDDVAVAIGGGLGGRGGGDAAMMDDAADGSLSLLLVDVAGDCFVTV